MAEEQDVLNRWRLVLGKYAANRISFGEGSIRYMDMEDVLDYLYSREYGEEQDIRQERGGNGDSQLTVPAWLHQMKRLFPRETVEIMERHALEKYQMTELLTDPEVLGRLEPNRELLKTILGLKHLMKGEVLRLAREIVRKVAEEITRKLSRICARQCLDSQTEQRGARSVPSAIWTFGKPSGKICPIMIRRPSSCC